MGMKARAKGAGSLEKAGRVWRARWVVGGKVYVRSTGTGNRQKAERLLAAWVEPFRDKHEEAVLRRLADRVADIRDRGRDVPLSGMAAAFEEVCDRRGVAASTAAHYRARLRAFAAWAAEKRPALRTMLDVDADAAGAFAADLARRMAPKTFFDYVSVLAMAWAKLCPPTPTRDNPWAGVEKPAGGKESHDRRALTEEELLAVFGAAQGEMRLLLAVGFFTGLRLGDVVRLDWSAIDTAKEKWVATLKPSKTKRRGTVVSIPVAAPLRAMLEATPPRRRRGPVFHELRAVYERDDSVLSGMIQDVFRSAGIETQSERAHGMRKAVDVGFHSLRHSFVSFAGNEGAPLAVVRKMVGHVSETMTEHYFHSSDPAARAVVDALPDVTRAAPAPTDNLSAFRAAVAALRPEQFKEAERMLREAGKARRVEIGAKAR